MSHRILTLLFQRETMDGTLMEDFSTAQQVGPGTELSVNLTRQHETDLEATSLYKLNIFQHCIRRVLL